jgi:hypothetical protein
MVVVIEIIEAAIKAIVIKTAIKAIVIIMEIKKILGARNLWVDWVTEVKKKNKKSYTRHCMEVNMETAIQSPVNIINSVIPRTRKVIHDTEFDLEVS